MQKTISSLIALQEEATTFVHSLVPRLDTATLVTLSGELGAGKTAFTQAVARALGVKEVVTSPTFVLEKLYVIPESAGEAGAEKKPTFKHLVHIDAYRLESGAQLTPLDFDTLMKSPENLILLEWPEKVADALPRPAVHISLAALSANLRTILYA